MLRVASAIVCLCLTTANVQAALVYLNSDELLDASSGIVWLNGRLTGDLPIDNIYTQNGWRLSEVYDGNGGPTDNVQGFIVSAFPDFFRQDRPFNREIYDVVEFLGGIPQTYPSIEVTGWSWGGGETDGLRNTHPEVILYGQWSPGTWRLDLDGGVASDQLWFTTGRLFLYRDATPDELAMVPAPAAIWLLGSALGAIGLVRRSSGIRSARVSELAWV